MMRRYLIWLSLIAIAALVVVPAALAQGEPIEGAQDLAAWASITGILLPILIAVVLRYRWSAQTKMIFAVGLALLDAVVVTGLTHGWHFDGHLMATAAAVLALSQVTYRNIWLKLGDNSTPPGEPGPEEPTSEPIISKLSRATG